MVTVVFAADISAKNSIDVSVILRPWDQNGYSSAVNAIDSEEVAWNFAHSVGKSWRMENRHTDPTVLWFLICAFEELRLEKAALDRQLEERDSQIAALSKRIQTAAADLVQLRAAKQQLEQTLQQQEAELSQAN